MQTNFTLAQLADPDTAEAEKILRTCVHCGFCTATCPTYVLLGDELDSPRGRIYLMKEMLEKAQEPTPQVVKHIDRCLSCLSCMTTCPSGVHYQHLVDQGRAYIEKTYRRPFLDRWTRALLAVVLPRPMLFRLALLAASLGRSLARYLPGPFGAMMALAPAHVPGPSALDKAGTFPATGSKRRGRVALLTGCAQTVLAPSINEATIRLLNRHGVEVVVPGGAGCCGALTHHLGRAGTAHAFAARNLDAWTREMDRGGLDAIIINASGCGTTVKDYGFMFRNDPQRAEKAARVSALAKDITEFLTEIGLQPPVVSAGQAIAYHSACSMQHGQRLKTQPRNLLAAAGFAIREISEGHLCCGSAGTYNILQPEIARQLRDRKVRNIEATGAVAVATGNIGCMTQIGGGTAMPVIHTVELLDWATGGPLPEALAQEPAFREAGSGSEMRAEAAE